MTMQRKTLQSERHNWPFSLKSSLPSSTSKVKTFSCLQEQNSTELNLIKEQHLNATSSSRLIWRIRKNFSTNSCLLISLTLGLIGTVGISCLHSCMGGQ